MSEGAAQAALRASALAQPQATRLWRAAAALWLLCVLAVAMHQWQFWRSGRINTDVLALLPQSEQAPEVARAAQVLGGSVSRQVVVLLGAPDWDAARLAAAAWREALARQGAPLQPAKVDASASAEAVVAFYGPWRDRLLTPQQRRALQEAKPAALVQQALSQLYQPGAAPRLQEWVADPLGLWPDWLAARAGQSKARPRDGELWMAGDGAQWLLLSYEITGSPFAMDGRAVYGPALHAAFEAARVRVPTARMHAAGLPLHAEAAAAQASREISTIGWGSLAAVLALAWLAFRGPAPILLTALSLVVGTATALSVTAWLFGEVHLLTLVFGASLVGVAEDYGIHYFAARQGRPWAQPYPLMRSLLPGLWLAWVTSALAYLALGLAPFPGLRQMAVFSATGLAAAFLTAVCWFPLLDRGTVRTSRFAGAIAASLARWPRAKPSATLWVAVAAVAAFSALGWSRLQPADSLRHWQSAPAQLLQAQGEIARLLGTPSVAQFYLVQGASQQELLEREEALKERLDTMVARGGLAGYAAVSDWVPSLRRQQADAQLTARTESQVLAGVNAALGEALQRPARGSTPLTPQAWLERPLSSAARGLWLGESGGQWSSVLMLHGLRDAGQLPALQAAADGLHGVRWVDKSADVASLLGRYRWAMAALLLAGHIAVLAALWWRYRRAAWRAWVPTAAGTVVTLACMGWLNEPFQLSTVLALLLLLGIGVDYGIFLLEQDGDGSAWLAVVLGAASTWLAFGLLALSTTPALHAFGLTLLIGILLVWAASPWLRRPPAQEAGT